MADIHHHGGSTIIEDREGPATVLAVLAVAALIGFLVWLFAFSGLVLDRNSSGGNDGGVTVNNEQQQDAPVQQQQPPQEPAPASS